MCENQSCVKLVSVFFCAFVSVCAMHVHTDARGGHGSPPAPLLSYPLKTICHCTWSFLSLPLLRSAGVTARAAKPIMLAQKKRKEKKISYQLSHLSSPMYLVCNPCPSCDVQVVRLMAGPVFLSCEIHADGAESGLVPARSQLSTVCPDG